MNSVPGPTSLTGRVADSRLQQGELRATVSQGIFRPAGSFTAKHLAQTLQYANLARTKEAKNFGTLPVHFFNQQTQPRVHTSTLPFQAGVDVGVIDINALIPNEV
jgi:hypothetical protein